MEKQMTWGEIKELVRKRERGDVQARQTLDDYARAEGYRDFDTYLVAAAGGDDPVVKMIMLRHEQPEIANDPVLGSWGERMEKDPAVEVVKNTRKRMTTTPIVIPPAPTAQNAPANGTRKGGRTPTPDSEKEKYVNDWKIAQAKGETQESFCVKVGIGTSTLRAWMRELDAKQNGK